MSHHHYEETRQKCIECWVAENAAGIGHLFTDDCFMLSPDNRIAMGKARVQALLPWHMRGLNRRSLLCTTLIAVLCTSICPSARGDPILFTTTVTSQEARNGDTTSDRKSTRLNSSHLGISYAVFCLKKKKPTNPLTRTATPSHPTALPPHNPLPP